MPVTQRPKKFPVVTSFTDPFGKRWHAGDQYTDENQERLDRAVSDKYVVEQVDARTGETPADEIPGPIGTRQTEIAYTDEPLEGEPVPEGYSKKKSSSK